MTYQESLNKLIDSLNGNKTIQAKVEENVTKKISKALKSMSIRYNLLEC